MMQRPTANPTARTGPRRRPPGQATRLAALLVAALSAGCAEGVTVVRGSGSIVQERRDLRHTDEIVLHGELDVAVRLMPALDQGTGGTSDTVVWIEGAGDLIDYVVTEVDGSTLRISYRDGVRLDPLPTIEIQCARLRRLSASGTGAVRITDLGVGLERGEACEIEAAGAVDIRADGEVDALILRQLGPANLHFVDVVAGHVNHSASGSGEAWIFATERVSTSITGTTEVFVSGPALVKETIAGSGRVHRKDPR